MNSEQTWGVEINQRGYGQQTIPKLCLEWVTRVDKENWHKKGVIVWSHQARRVEVLSAAHALQYLEHMRTNDNWQVDGLPILRQSIVLRLDDTRKKKGKRQTPDEKELDAEEKSSKGETVVVERFRLAPDQSAEFLKFLEANEPLLQKMADEDEQERTRALWQVYGYFFKLGHEHEADEIDFSARPFTWQKDANTNTWICDRPPNRASVALTEDNFFWQGWIERPDRFKDRSPYIVKLEEALTWAEQQLQAAEEEANQPAEDKWQRVPMAELMVQKREELAHYWIDPTTLEPERITYRVFINLDYAPYDYKTMEMSFGKQLRYDEKFISPTQLVRDLQLDPQLDIDHHTRGFFVIVSRVTYYQQDIAMAQAQKFWDQSSIVQRHRAGKVLQAEYGIMEVETGYPIIIGACENPDQPYPPPQSREEHLAESALGLTLAYALDVEGYRSYLGLRPGRITDQKILEIMHSHRARSAHLPLEAQLESERWLRVNKVK